MSGVKANIPSEVLASHDTIPLFHDWTEENWTKAAGLVLVIAIDVENKKRRYLCSVKKRDDFDLVAHRQNFPTERIQFMELPKL